MRFSRAIIVSSCVLLLSGCLGTPGINTSETASSPDQGMALQGTVHGGQNPIAGASVYLYAANTTGYGNASVSLLTAGSGRTEDGNGNYYVTTGADGSFGITGEYSCPGTASQVYLYSVGGNSGSGTNSAAGLLAAIGTCPAGGTLSSGSFINMNEVTTIAAAYAMAGFATDATHVSSSGTTAAKLGIANAFLNAAELATLSTGVANAAPPAGVGTTANGPGIIPQTEINSLANILAACINTSESTSSACTTLFDNAKNGSITPTDTATAAINIAHNPAANVAALYGLSTATPPFAPALTGQPNDFSMSIYWENDLLAPGPIAVDAAGDIWWANGGADETNSQGYNLTQGYGYSGVSANVIAIDVNGDLWGTASGSVGELGNTGTVIGNYTSGLSGITQPSSIAMDTSTNAWIANAGSPGSVIKVSSAGALSGTFTGNGLATPEGVAVDPSGSVWIADKSNAIIKLSSTGSPLSGSAGYTGGGLSAPMGIAIDHAGNVWVADSGDSTVTELASTGTSFVSGTSGYTGSSLSGAYSIAIDGSGNAWVASNSSLGANTITEISSAGTFLSGANGFASGGELGTVIEGIAIDGSGDVWTNSDSYNFLYGYTYYIAEMVGAATPVVTPLAVGVKNNTLGTRP